MATRQVVGYVASCDVCGYECDSGSGWGETEREAIEDLTVNGGLWIENNGRLVCDTSDPAHNKARGAEAPQLLAITQDAMTVRFEEAA